MNVPWISGGRTLGQLGVSALLAAVFVALAPAPIGAEETGAAQAATCIAERIAQGRAPNDCVDARHAICTGLSQQTPAVAVVCFRTAEQEWSQASRAILDRLQAEAPEEITAIAGIELKYDLLSGRLQCDRIEELAIAVSDHGSEAIARQKARCQATAAGLAHVRLAWRARPGT